MCIIQMVTSHLVPNVDLYCRCHQKPIVPKIRWVCCTPRRGGNEIGKQASDCNLAGHPRKCSAQGLMVVQVRKRNPMIIWSGHDILHQFPLCVASAATAMWRCGKRVYKHKQRPTTQRRLRRWRHGPVRNLTTTVAFATEHRFLYCYSCGFSWVGAL